MGHMRQLCARNVSKVSRKVDMYVVKAIVCRGRRNCAVRDGYVPWKANMCQRKWLCAIGGHYLSWKMNMVPWKTDIFLGGRYICLP